MDSVCNDVLQLLPWPVVCVSHLLYNATNVHPAVGRERTGFHHDDQSFSDGIHSVFCRVLVIVCSYWSNVRKFALILVSNFRWGFRTCLMLCQAAPTRLHCLYESAGPEQPAETAPEADILHAGLARRPRLWAQATLKRTQQDDAREN